jgi:hypothetical protein
VAVRVKLRSFLTSKPDGRELYFAGKGPTAQFDCQAGYAPQFVWTFLRTETIPPCWESNRNCYVFQTVALSTIDKNSYLYYFLVVATIIHINVSVSGRLNL